MEEKSSVRGEEEIEDTLKGNSISRGGGEEEDNVEGDVVEGDVVKTCCTHGDTTIPSCDVGSGCGWSDLDRGRCCI